jgi:hypothetical protein
MRIRIGSWSDFEIKKMNFYMKNVLEVENSSKNIPTKVLKPFRKAGNPVYLIILVKCSWIHIPDTNPDPDPHHCTRQYKKRTLIACKWSSWHCMGCVLNTLRN